MIFLNIVKRREPRKIELQGGIIAVEIILIRFTSHHFTMDVIHVNKKKTHTRTKNNAIHLITGNNFYQRSAGVKFIC